MKNPEEIRGDFATVFTFLLNFRLNEKELKYILWHIVNGKNYREIARLEGRGMTKQAIHYIVNKALKRIRAKCKGNKKYKILFYDL